MASAGAHLPPWDRGNVQGQEYLVHSQYKEVLNKSRVILRDNLRLHDVWSHLHQMGVITQNDEERMRLNATNYDSVDRLIKFLNKCQTWCYHALLRAMALTQQGHLIPQGGHPSAVYMEGIQPSITTPGGPVHDSRTSTSGEAPTGLPPQKQHFYKKVESEVNIPISADLLPGLLRHCEVSEHILMKAGLFGFDKDITMDITEFHICTDVKCEHNREKTSINSKQLFNRLLQRHPPNTLLIEGEAGSGKSTYMQDYAHRHCKEFTDCEGKGPGSPCLGHSWKLILYIPAGSVIGSQEAAIREHLHCDDKHKDKITTMINKDGEGVLIMNDGLDEVRKDSERESMRQYSILHQKSGGPKMLFSSRTGLCQIEKRIFDRMVTLEGFSVIQGVQYVEQYFMKGCPLNVTDLSDLLEYIKDHAAELEWVLTNPLHVHIFSELAVSGKLSPEDIKTLTRVKLLKILEAFILKRDEICREADIREFHSLKFYRLCLEYFLKDERRIAEVHVPDTSPYKAFLNKHKRIDLFATEESYFMFGHEIFFEFFAIQGLIEHLKSKPSSKKALMLCLCANPTTRNALQLLCGHISEYEPTLHDNLVFIIQACLILQVEEQRCEKNKTTERLLELPDLIKHNFTASTVYKGVSEEQATLAMDICEKIQAAFNKNAESLRTAGWFFNFYEENRFPTPHLEFITRCLRQCTQSLQEEVCSQTTHQLLPCVRYGVVVDDGIQDDYVFAASSRRWGIVQDIYEAGDSLSQIVINVWCPSDVIPALTQFYTHRNPAHPTGGSCFTIHLSGTALLWGEPPAEEWVCEKWVCALRELFKHRLLYIGVITYSPYSTTPLCGLISALQQVITPTHSLTEGIGVYDGQVNEEVLEEFCEWAQTVNLRVKLGNTTVLLSADRDQHYVTRLHQRVRHIMTTDNPPTYRTPGGRTVEYGTLGDLLGGTT